MARALRQVVEETVAEMQTRRKEFAGDAINWTDFHVTEVRQKFVIVLSKADPASNKARVFVEDRLIEAGFYPNEFEVICEW